MATQVELLAKIEFFSTIVNPMNGCGNHSLWANCHSDGLSPMR